MHDPIRRTLEWMRLLFCAGTGKRRRTRHRAYVCLHISAVRHPSAPLPPRLPRHRSPYGLATPLDGSHPALVRPYLAADLGIDLDGCLVGAREVAA
ncbi:hypothetical protein ACLVWQ_12575 [Streptomyces sp. CWNU-52B]|uniref:hypothetical protein n=1 Tax=unclassified Streptomyces TaxID=2593676 RepID=UPI0039C07380